MKIEEQIEQLISENKNSFEIAKVIKKEIKEYLSSLDIVFEKSQGKDFLVQHTKKIDSFIKIIYQYVLRDFFGYYMPMRSSLPITLVALGSYGREQLCVYSDIDLMVVYKPTKGYNLLPMIEAIMQMAWDSGMNIGHRVHQIGELFEASNSDITIKTAMIESRFLIGSKPLWFGIEANLKRMRKYEQKFFITEKLVEYKNRVAKHKLSMQPNIKESMGGLRDMNMLFWVGNILYGVNRVKDLEGSLINENEYKEIRKAVEFLYMVRSALHLSCGKKIDTLTLDRLYDVAKKLGFSSTKNRTAEIQLVQRLLKNMWSINIISNILMRKTVKNINFDKKNIAKLKKNRIDKNFYIHNDTLVTSFFAKPETMQEVIEKLFKFKSLNIDFDITFIDYLKKSLDGKIKIQTIRELFAKPHIYKFLFAIYEAGALAKVFPPLKAVINLPQFDGYHQYPVDIHSLYTVKYLENIKDENILEVYNLLDAPHQMVLKLVALLHDCGKGRVEDHSILGARIFKSYAQKLKLDDELIENGALLIAHHTTMSNIAQRKDIYNENVILQFASPLKNAKVLKMLYVLTYADMSAVGDNIYSNYSSKLIYKLFQNAHYYIDNKILMNETQLRIKEEKILQKDERFLNLSRLKQKKILSITSNLFFIKNKKDKILEIIDFVENTKNGYIYDVANTKSLTIKIARDANYGLNLAYLLGKLSHLQVVAIDIFKLYNEIKFFKIEFKERVEDFEIDYIKEIINNSYDMSKKVKLKKPIIKKEELEYNCNHSKSYARMTTDIQNQRGLMAYMVYVFDEFNIDIVSTKVQTIKQRARNLFLIEKNGNFCANQTKVWDKLISTKK